MKPQIILAGSGGCMRELAWQMPDWQISGYVDVTPPEHPVTVGDRTIPYLGNDDFLLQRCNCSRRPSASPKDCAEITEESPHSFSEHHSPRSRGLFRRKTGPGLYHQHGCKSIHQCPDGRFCIFKYWSNGLPRWQIGRFCHAGTGCEVGRCGTHRKTL